MATIISKNIKSRTTVSNQFEERSGLCRETTIKINNDGTVVSGGVLNLGRVGDQMVTTINIDTTNLVWNSLSNNNISLNDAYQPLLIFQNTNGGARTSIEFEGNYFFVPESITSTATTYNIIYVLKEKTDDPRQHNGNVGPESDSTYQEVFVSQPFSGVVHDSLKSRITNPTSLSSNLVVAENVALQKPQINIDWNGKTGLTISQSVLGEKFDRLITPLVVNNFPNNRNYPDGVYEIFFIKDSTQYKYQTTSTPLKLWIPVEVTNAVGAWSIGVHYVDSIDSPSVEAYSDLIVATVKDNFLNQDDLTLDETQSILADLVDANGEVLQVQAGEDEDGNPIYQDVMTYELTGNSYQLGYFGLDVDETIGWVQTNKTAILSHINNSTIHISSTDRNKWDSAATAVSTLNNQINGENGLKDQVDRIEDVLESLDINVDNAVTQEQLQEIVEKTNGLDARLTAIDKSPEGELPRLKSRTSAVEAKAEKNKSDIENVWSALVPIQDFVETNESAFSTLSGQILQEAENRTLADNNLQQGINNIYSNNDDIESGVLMTKVADLQGQIGDAVTSLEGDIKDLSGSVDTSFQQIADSINGLDDDVIKLGNDLSSAVKNEPNDLIKVVTIKFLSSEQEYQYLIDNGLINPNTLYLIQEEE